VPLLLRIRNRQVIGSSPIVGSITSKARAYLQIQALHPNLILSVPKHWTTQFFLQFLHSGKHAVAKAVAFALPRSFD